jgi:large conductance mechanosensitive channel
MSMISEFKEFALKGNVIDLAVGVIIGGAFGKIVNSVIEDLIMPVVGKAIGNVDFSNLYIPLSDKITAGMSLADAKKVGPAFAYGSFLTIAINFAILAFCIFMLVKAMNTLKRREEVKPAPVAEVPADVKILTEIRDLLRK